MYAAKRGRKPERRGVVLLIVLALLGLFCAVGVSFAVLARSEGRGALNFKQGIQAYNGPAPRDLLKGALDQLISDTTNPQSSLRGHSLLRDMYGGWDRAVRSGVAPNYVYGPTGYGAELRMNPNGTTRDYMGAFNGTGIFRPRRVLDPTTAIPPADPVANGALSQAEIVQQIGRLFVPREFGLLSSDPVANPAPNTKNWFPFLPYNFQIFDQIGLRSATAPIGGDSSSSASGSGQPLTPELYAYFDTAASAWRYHWFPFDEDYDAPDHNNWYLALERADGTCVVPSFHRPHLVWQLEQAGVFGPNPNTNPAYNSNAAENEAGASPIVSGRRILFRPRRVDVDANTVLGTGLPANFPTLRDLNGNGRFGDVPEELDVDTDGDGKPDAVWVDLGVKPFRQEDGTLVKPLFAFKVVAMDGKININLAGNFVANRPGSPLSSAGQVGVEGRPEGHVSAYGASPAEINPRHALTLDQQNSAALAGPDLDGTRGDYWPVWQQHQVDLATPTFYDPLSLRLLMNGLPPLTAGGKMPATSNTVYVPGRWTNPNALAATFLNDRPGQPDVDDDGSQPRVYNANIPTEPVAGAPSVRGVVSSSLGPVGFRAGRRYPPFSRRAAVLGSNVGQVFPKFVNHMHADARDGRAYWPGYNPTSAGYPAATPAMVPALTTAGTNTGEFDVGTPPVPPGTAPFGSMNIPAPSFFFDVSNFGQMASAGFIPLVPPTGANAWFPTPGAMAVTHGTFPLFLQAMERLETFDDPDEINPYLGTSTYNQPFTNAQIEQMLRFPDVDSSTLDDRVLRLQAFNVGAETKQVIGTPYQYNAVQAARERNRRMWTAESWEINHFSVPPTFGDPSNIPGSPTYPGSATMLASRNGPLPDDSALYTSPAGTANPPYGVLQTTNGSFQHNGKLWTPPIAGWTLPIAPLGFSYYVPVIAPGGAVGSAVPTPALPVLGPELASRYPSEILKGRRYDLNRPLTSYESNPAYAEAERTAMAEQIYVLLYLSAGLNMRPLPSSIEEAKEALAQARTLAQLAVNIVDYVDPDNVMTTMRFHPFLTCPSMTTAPSMAVRTTPALQWDDIELYTTDSVTFNFGTVSLPNVRSEELTVMGFEMPDLVINEGVSVTIDDPSVATPGAGTNEITFAWAELFNPWPNETDLDSGAAGVSAPLPRGRLFDFAPAAGGPAGSRTVAQSRFVLGVRQNNGPAANNKAPTAPVGADFHAATQRFVHFAGTGMPGVTTPDGAFTTPRDQANNGPDIRGGQRLLVEPNRFADPAGMGMTDDPSDLLKDPGSPTTFWTPSQGPNRFTCVAPTDMDRVNTDGQHDLRMVRPKPATKDANDANVAITLYRVRNPYCNWHPTANPYIAIDTLELRGDAAAGQPNAEGAYDLTKTTPPTPPERRSMERKQPWQGSNRPWVPYRGIANPATAMNTLVDIASTPARFLEGKFLNFPYLTADGTTGTPSPSMTTQLWGNQLFANGFARCTNATIGNTMYGSGETTATPYPTNHTATQNTQDAALATNNSRYMSFPFLNRQLASPLELLSVRLYGSYPWAVPNADGAAGATAVVDREWRLRFTDDYEFFQDAANNQTGGASGYPGLPGGGFNRVYRSREVPWFLNDRKLHPLNVGQVGYDPTAAAGSTTESANRLAPFPNLYRFFELVETHSRVNGAGGWSTQAVAAGGGAADLREDRVPGKINVNAIADEEILKALLDDEAVMPLWIQNNGSIKLGDLPAPAGALSLNPPAAPDGDDRRYRPINYPIDLSAPFGSAPGAVRGLAWNGFRSELLISMAADDNANNRNFINSTVGGGNAFIDFGGFASTAGTAQAAYPGSDLSQNLALANYERMIHNQFPGIVNGYYGYNGASAPMAGLYPGWDRELQVSSEFFRAFVFSRNGRDGLWGTADDKAFTGFGSAYLADTLLRRRNYAALDFPNDGRYASTASPPIVGSAMSNTSGTTNPGAPGEYITRLGGQWTPRLFDPVPLPFTLDGNPASTAPGTITPANTLTMARRADVAPAPGGAAPNAVEYWMLETRRNELLGKIASNTTSRSNVFGVWITVGYFRVEPGTENLLVPLLHEEVGSTTGTQRRHRMFAILDRTQAKQFTELMTTNPPKLEDNAIVRHYSFIE